MSFTSKRISFPHIIICILILFIGIFTGFLFDRLLRKEVCDIGCVINDNSNRKPSTIGKIIFSPLSSELAKGVSSKTGLLVTSFWSDKTDSDACTENGAGEVVCVMENKQFNREFVLFSQPKRQDLYYDDETLVKMVFQATPGVDVTLVPGVSYRIGNFNVIGVNDSEAGRLYGFYSSDAKNNYWGYARVADEDKDQLDIILRFIN